ncbi:MAG: single-stranded DNA-binding protein [Erysipelotrichaceae bacterium]|nr:single-stranded DNA-binding protein [Erysipelotrichaceae bacterium]
MYNYFMVVGRLCNDIDVKQLGDGRKVVNLTLAVGREFKNNDGTYSTDFIRISLWEFLADIASDNLKKGRVIGVKGRISPRHETLQSGAVVPINDLIGERIVFYDSINEASSIEADMEDES